MILIVDNGMFSHTLNLMLRKLNKETLIIKSMDLKIDLIDNYHIDGIIVTNGIEKKENINNSIKIIQRFAWRVPILGIGIGAVAIGVLFNAKTMETKLNNIEPFLVSHDNRTIFHNINKELFSTKWCRYTLSDEMIIKTDLEISARSDKEIVAFRHKNLAIEGLFLDITSLSCMEGEKILTNFLNYYLK